MPTIALILIVAVIAAAAGIGGGYFIGYNNRKKTAEAQIGSAEAEATRLVNEAIKTAALRSPVRRTASTRRKQLWTVRPKLWRKKKKS